MLASILILFCRIFGMAYAENYNSRQLRGRCGGFDFLESRSKSVFELKTSVESQNDLYHLARTGGHPVLQPDVQTTGHLVRT